MLTIREATTADYADIDRLLGEGDADHARALPDLFQVRRPARPPAFFREWLVSANHYVWLAEEADEILGAVKFQVRTPPPGMPVVPRTYIFIDALVVTQARRRSGIGQALMEAVQSWAIARGIDEIGLNVYAFNEAALHLYHKLGYETISMRLIRRLRS
jgi:ribosomal protein S18 acetylase RimI-like enzyme